MKRYSAVYRRSQRFKLQDLESDAVRTQFWHPLKTSLNRIRRAATHSKQICWTKHVQDFITDQNSHGNDDDCLFSDFFFLSITDLSTLVVFLVPALQISLLIWLESLTLLLWHTTPQSAPPTRIFSSYGKCAHQFSTVSSTHRFVLQLKFLRQQLSVLCFQQPFYIFHVGFVCCSHTASSKWRTERTMPICSIFPQVPHYVLYVILHSNNSGCSLCF